MNRSTAPDGKEKRRYARKPTRQSAQVRFPDGTALPAEIRDYCQAGLFVRLPAERMHEVVFPTLVGSPVSVGFSEGGGAQARAYRIEGKVARVADQGIGIFAPALPQEALEALHRASVRAALPGGDQLDQGRTQALHQECTTHFRRFLDAVMQEFFLQAEERLTQAGQSELSFLERSRYEYGVEELKAARSRIEDDFFNATRERIQVVGPLAEQKNPAERRSALSLVDEAEFEDWLNLSAVIRQIEQDVSPQLGEFEQRYSRLIGRPVDRKSNPFGPETLGRTFQGAIQSLDFTNPMRTVLYKALGVAVSAHAHALYRQLNQVLAELQPVQPEPAAAAPKPATPPAAVTEPGTKPDLNEIAETLNRLYSEGQAVQSASLDNAEYSLDRIMATLDRASRARTATAQVIPTPHAMDAQAILELVGRLQATRRQLSGEAPAATPQAARTLPEASLRELLTALENLPLGPVQSVRGGAGGTPLAEQIDGHIVSAEGEARRIAPVHRQILETTSQLFGQARADLVPNSEIESLIKRLERPLLKLALLDRRFPSTPDHPARQVLNLIEQFSIAADDQGKFFDTKLQRFLYLLVDRVCSRAEEDPAVYDQVRDSLAKVLLPIMQTRRARVARLQEASEGRERIRTARMRVNEALETRLAGREVPAIVLRLLDAGWRQYLVLLEMREGMQSAGWKAGLAVLDRVLARLAIPAPADELTALLGEIEHGLAAVNVDADLRATFMDALGNALADPALDTAPVFVPPGRLLSRQSSAQPNVRLAERLRLGDWWKIGTGKELIPMQLIWLSRPPYSCTFANRSATRKLDFTLDELAQQIRNGRAVPGSDFDVPLLDRSEHALFDDSYRELAHQALHDPLTGLPNRKGFLQHLQQLPPRADAGRTHVVGIIEFDQFRLIRNVCGEQAMETLVRSLVNRMRTLLGAGASLAALADDTLGLMLPDCSRVEGCTKLKELLEQMRDFPFTHGPHSYRIGFSLGLSEYDPGAQTAAEALRRADAACLSAKSLGRNQIQLYERQTTGVQNLESLMGWAGRIDRYLKGDGLFLRCQKVVPTVGRGAQRKPYCEILLGVDDGAGGTVPPDQFIPVVEHLQRAHELDIWVIGSVLAWIRNNRPAFENVGGVAINLSARSLGNPELAGYLKTQLALGDVPADRLIFEITESTAIASYGVAQDFIRDMRRYGCKFSLDDFGSGFTSYSHLKNLRTDTLKIDGSFVRDMLTSPADHAMVKSMNDIAHSLGLTTVAEYVESPELLAALEAIGVDYVQGYAVHKPCRLEAFAP